MSNGELSRLDRNLKPILPRRQRARRIGRKGTWRIEGPVKVQNYLSIHRSIGVEKASRTVCRFPACLVTEDNEQLLVFKNRLQSQLFSEKGEVQDAGAHHLV